MSDRAAPVMAIDVMNINRKQAAFIGLWVLLRFMKY